MRRRRRRRTLVFSQWLTRQRQHWFARIGYVQRWLLYPTAGVQVPFEWQKVHPVQLPPEKEPGILYLVLLLP